LNTLIILKIKHVYEIKVANTFLPSINKAYLLTFINILFLLLELKALLKMKVFILTLSVILLINISEGNRYYDGTPGTPGTPGGVKQYSSSNGTPGTLGTSAGVDHNAQRPTLSRYDDCHCYCRMPNNPDYTLVHTPYYPQGPQGAQGKQRDQ
jgi:hypothetical protein